MPTDLASFLAVLARTSGFVAMAGVPGVTLLAGPSRVLLALGLAVVIWPAAPPAAGPWPAWSLGVEFLWGSLLGAIASWLNEMLVLAMQMVGLQAGYTFASTVDPATQADAAILQVLAQLLSGMLFFLTGMDHALVRLLASSFTPLPAGGGAWPAAAGPWLAGSVIAWTARILAEALTFALPAAAFLLLADLAMGLLNRLHAQLPLLTLAAPVKMLAALVLVAAALGSAPALYRRLGDSAIRLIEAGTTAIR